ADLASRLHRWLAVPMSRTMRFGSAELRLPGKRGDGHAFAYEDRQTPISPAQLAHGTPLPPSDPRSWAEEQEALDLALTVPVPREELDLEEPEPLPPIEMPPGMAMGMQNGIGMRT